MSALEKRLKQYELPNAEEILEVAVLEDDQEGFSHGLYFAEALRETLGAEGLQELTRQLGCLDGIEDVIYVTRCYFYVVSDLSESALRLKALNALAETLETSGN